MDDKKKLEEIKKIYKSFSPDIDTQAVHSESRVQRNWHQEKLDSVLGYLEASSGVVLDLGCGSGGLTMEFAKRRPDLEIVGIDFNEDAIKMANANAKKLNRKNISFKSSPAEYMPFKDNFFDAVTGFDVLDHLVNYKKSLDEVNRVLKKNSPLIFTVGNYKSIFPIIEILWDKMGDGRNYHDTHLTHFTKSLLVNEIPKHGFKIQKIDTIHVLKPFFNLVTEYYPKSVEKWLGEKGFGMTLVACCIKE